MEDYQQQQQNNNDNHTNNNNNNMTTHTSTLASSLKSLSVNSHNKEYKNSLNFNHKIEERKMFSKPWQQRAKLHAYNYQQQQQQQHQLLQQQQRQNQQQQQQQQCGSNYLNIYSNSNAECNSAAATAYYSHG